MAELPIDIHAEAHLEEEEAFHWYRERSRKAADAFLQEIEDARKAIQNSPQSWAKYLHGTRRYLLKRFPYIIVYRVTEHRIEVIAVAHGRRKPGYRVNRLPPSH
jgi:plasmid stabilization system protein ParE